MGIFDAIGSYFSDKADRNNQKDINTENADLQREFAQNGIRWKVDDAAAAGISPLYALGANTTPGQASFQAAPPSQFGSKLGGAIDEGIDRARQAKQTQMERLQERLLSAQIDGQEIENAKKRSDIALTSGAQSQPPMPNRHDITTGPEGFGRTPSQDMANVMGNSPRDLVMQYGFDGVDDFKYFAKDMYRKIRRAGGARDEYNEKRR